MKETLESLMFGLSFVTFIGFSLVVFVALGYFAGLWVDNNYLLHPFGKIVGVLLGVLMAVYSIYKNVRKFLAQNNK